MAPKGPKRGRPAAAGSTVHAAKRQALDPASSQCAAVEEALRSAPGLPDEVRELLAAAVGTSVRVVPEERHPFQQEVVAMLADALSTLEKAAEATVEAAQQRLARAEGEQQLLKEPSAKAEALLAAARAAASERLAAFEASTQALSESMKQVQVAEAKQREGNKESYSFERKKAEIERTLKEICQPLVEAAPEGPEGKKRLNALTSFCKKQGFEDTLLQVVPGVLGKPQDQRGTFGETTVKQLLEEFSGRIAKLDASIKEGEGARAERAAAVTEALEAQKLAEAALLAADAASSEARAERSKAEAAVKEAHDAEAAFLAGLALTGGELDAAKDELEALRSGALAAFALLRDPPRPPSHAEAEVDPEEVAKAVEDVVMGVAAPEEPPAEPAKAEAAFEAVL